MAPKRQSTRGAATKRATATKPVISKPTASKSTASKPAASKPAATKSAATKPPATKPAAAKPAAAKNRVQESVPEPVAKRASAAVANTKKRRAPEEAVEPSKKRAKSASSGTVTTKKDPAQARVPKPRPIAKAAPKKSVARKVTHKPAHVEPPLATINTTPTRKLEIFVCGEGSSGELGLGTKNSIDVKRPRLNANLDAKTVGVVQLSSGGMHCVALTHDNKILTWGVNDQGALGRDTTWDGGLRDIGADGSSSDSESDASDSGLNPFESVPTAISSDKFPDGTHFVQVAAGDSCSFALTDTGLVYGWGTFRDNNGVFGFTLDSKRDIVLVQNVPLLIPDLKNIKSLSVRGDYALALDSDGNVFGWGNGQQDQLGRRLIDRRRKDALLPIRIALPRKQIASIHTGLNHAFAIDKDGNTWAWGSNNFAQTGIVSDVGEDGNTVTAPTKVPSLVGRNMKSIQGGSHHSIGITQSGKCLAWGRLDGSQMGIDISKLPIDEPTKIVVDERNKPRIALQPISIPNLICSYVAAGSDHNIAITTDGKAYSWGFNANYQCGQGTDDDIELATEINNTAVRGKRLVWAGAGGQYSMLAACYMEANTGETAAPPLTNGINGINGINGTHGT